MPDETINLIQVILNEFSEDEIDRIADFITEIRGQIIQDHADTLMTSPNFAISIDVLNNAIQGFCRERDHVDKKSLCKLCALDGHTCITREDAIEKKTDKCYTYRPKGATGIGGGNR